MFCIEKKTPRMENKKCIRRSSKIIKLGNHIIIYLQQSQTPPRRKFKVENNLSDFIFVMFY